MNVLDIITCIGRKIMSKKRAFKDDRKFLLFIKVCVSDDIMTFCWNLLLLVWENQRVLKENDINKNH